MDKPNTANGSRKTHYWSTCVHVVNLRGTGRSGGAPRRGDYSGRSKGKRGGHNDIQTQGGMMMELDDRAEFLNTMVEEEVANTVVGNGITTVVGEEVVNTVVDTEAVITGDAESGRGGSDAHSGEYEERVTVYADHTVVSYHISTQEEVLLEW